MSSSPIYRTGFVKSEYYKKDNAGEIKNMKITAITSSAHKNGTSSMMADEFIRGAKEAGHEIFRFDAAFKSIHPCIGGMKVTIDRFFANNMALYGATKRLALITTMSDPALAAEGANTTFQLIADLYKWEVAGIINAENSGDVEALKKTDFLKKAYDFGRSILQMKCSSLCEK